MRKPEAAANGVASTKLRKGLWSPEEDDKLIGYMLNNGQGCWSDVARNAGLQRCGKSCRLRWINYLRPDLKRSTFSPHEEHLIIHLLLFLATDALKLHNLPGRTDNEIKNFSNSIVKKRLKNLSSTLSPNSSSSSPSGDSKSYHFVGLFSAQDQQQQGSIILVYSADPSSSVITLNAFPLLSASHCGPFFPIAAPTFLGQAESGFLREDDSFFNLPLLQSVNTTSVITATTETIIKETNHSNYLIDNINRLPNNNNSKIESISGVVGANFLHEDFSLGEWDLEDLMKDIPSFPCLNFQVQ